MRWETLSFICTIYIPGLERLVEEEQTLPGRPRELAPGLLDLQILQTNYNIISINLTSYMVRANLQW